MLIDVGVEVYDIMRFVGGDCVELELGGGSWLL